MPLIFSKRLSVLILAAVVFGIALSVYWFFRLNLEELAGRLRHLNVLYLVAMVAIGTPGLGVRLLRWHFFLRNSGFRVRAADSARIFLAALVMVMTPGYVGELIKAYWLRRSYGIALCSSIPLIFFERFFDVLALLTFFIVAAWFRSWSAVGAFIVLAAALGVFWHFFCPACVRLASFLGRVRLLLFLRHSHEETPPDIAQLRRPYFFAVSFAMSLIAWAPGVYALKLIVASFGERLPLGDSVRIFSGGTLLGGACLIPGGIAVTSTWFINEIEKSGFRVSDAILAAALLRFLTLWFAFGIGVLTYLLARRRQPLESLEKVLHFDEVAQTYDAQIPVHIRNLLVQRKTDHMLAFMERPTGESRQTMDERGRPALGLDVGCGLGWYMARMTQRGRPTVGFDASLPQARQARQRSERVVAADALAIPFADKTFDFAYSINVLHHLSGREAQQRAFDEIARVLKPGGWFFLHEINVRNPLFRFYAGYVFPLIKNIDEGTEFWIRPRELADTDKWFARKGTEYFTFLPDFTPRFLLGAARRIEAFLERTPLRVWSAHYMAALRRKP